VIEAKGGIEGIEEVIVCIRDALVTKLNGKLYDGKQVKFTPV
jgi:hypothetical protein